MLCCYLRRTVYFNLTRFASFRETILCASFQDVTNVLLSASFEFVFVFQTDKHTSGKMHMWFWIGTDLESFLFPGYNVTSIGGFVATCFGLAAIAILYEGMKLVQVKLRLFTMSSLPKENSGNSEISSLLSRVYPKSFKPISSCHCKSWSRWFLETFHWSLHTLLGYLLMLSVMTFNGYVSIALAIGGCFGYWIFGPSLIALNISQFQAKSQQIDCSAHCSGTLSTERRGSTVSTAEEELASVSQANVEVHVHAQNEEIS